MSRVRLTKRIKANDPGDMDGSRQKLQPKMDQYSNFDPAKDDVGDRKVKTWKEDSKLRDEMNVTKIKQAKAWQASKLATKLSIYLLGEKAPGSMVKAQAAEFLSLGNDKLARAVSRFAKTAYLYADEQEVETGCDCGECDECKAAAQEKEEEACAVAEEEVKEQVKEEVETAQEKEEEACAVAEEEVKEQVKEEKEEQEEIPAEDEIVEQETEETEDEVTDAELASIFADNSNDVVAPIEEPKMAKKGVQKMVQPSKVASSHMDLSGIWESAPDVSKVF